MSQTSIVIYSTPNCPWCKRTKEFLIENKIKYKEFDVSTNMKKREEMIEKSGQLGVPVTDVDGKIVIGFDKAKLEKLLKIKK